MRPKTYAVMAACVLLGGSAFALWRWGVAAPGAKSPFPVYDPARYPQAAAVNQALEGHSAAEQDMLIYPLVAALDAQALCALVDQSQALRPQSRELAMEAAALRLGEIAPQQGWAALQKTSPFDTSAGQALFTGWASRDFDAARKAVDAVSSRERRSELARALLQARAEKFPAQAAACAIADLYAPKAVGLDQILLLWSYKDRPAALAFGLEHNRANALDALFIHWFADDRAAAMDRLAQFPEKPRQELLDALWADDAFIAADPDRARALLEKFPAERATVQQNRYLAYLTARLAVDRAQAIRETCAILEKDLRKQALEHVVKALSKSDPQAALDTLRALSQSLEEADFDALFAETFSPLSEKDPIALLNFLNTLPGLPQMGWRSISSIFDDVPPAQFPQARELLEKMKFANSDERGEAYRALARVISKKDRNAALEWMKATQDPRLKKEIAKNVLAAAAEGNLDQALALHRQLSKDFGAAFDASIVIANAHEISDPQAMLQWTMQNAKGSELSRALNHLFSKVYSEDRQAALALYAGLPDEDFKKTVGESLVSSMQYNDPEAALKLAKTLGNPSLVRELQTQMLMDEVEGDFEGALARLRDPAALEIILPQGSSPRDFSGNEFISTLMRADPDRLWDTIATLPEGPRAKLVGIYANELSQTDPQRALDLICETDIQPGQSDFFAVYSNWMSLDPAEGMQWIENRFPDINTSAFYYMETLNGWLRIDPAGASQWLAQQPPGEWRDEMVGILIAKESANDPDSAFRWAVTMSDGSKKEKVLSAIYAFWSKSDPMAAQNALNEAAVSPQVRQAILKQEGNP